MVLVRRAIAEAEHRQRHDRRAEILGVQLEEVPTPVALEHAVELGQDRRDELFRWQRVADRVLPAPAAPAFAAGRERDVGEKRECLDRGERDTEQHRAQRQRDDHRPIPSGRPLRREEREVQRPQPCGDQQIVGHLVVRTQQAEPHHEREQRVASGIAVAHRLDQGQEGERRQRGDEQLPVVSRLHQRGHDPVSSYPTPPTMPRRPRPAERTQQEVHGESGEDQVEREAEVHRGVHRQEPPEPRRRIEDVPVHGGDEREAAEEVRVPLRDVPRLPERLGAVEAEAVSRDVLVVTEQEPAAEHRPAEGQCGGNEDGQRQCLRPLRLDQVLSCVSGRHWASPEGTAGRARPRPVR